MMILLLQAVVTTITTRILLFHTTSEQNKSEKHMHDGLKKADIWLNNNLDTRNSETWALKNMFFWMFCFKLTLSLLTYVLILKRTLPYSVNHIQTFKCGVFFLSKRLIIASRNIYLYNVNFFFFFFFRSKTCANTYSCRHLRNCLTSVVKQLRKITQLHIRG